MMNKWSCLVSYLLAYLMSSCSIIGRENGEQVTNLVRAQIAQEVDWQKECYHDSLLTDIINKMANQKLSIDQAVQIALLNNPHVQAAFEEVGIAQADLIEAGLLSNPIFEGFIRYPDKKHLKSNTELSVMQSFLDLFLIPLRTKIAAAELQAVIYKVSHRIILLSFEVETTYYQLMAAHKKKTLLKMMIELAEVANQISLAQNRIGNVSDLDLNLRTAQYLEKTVELVEVEKEMIELRDMLNRLMGLSHDSCWIIEDEFSFIPECELDLDCLEWKAFNERLDIQAARWEVERIRRSFPTAEGWTFTDLQGGILTERDSDGIRVTGPQFAARLPIFNYGQAVNKRFMAQFRQAQADLIGLEIDSYAEVRKARNTLLVFRNQVIFYATKILPNQEQIVNSTEELYNVMGIGIYALLDSKRNQLQAYYNYYLALRDYWVAKVNLNKAVGGKFDIIGNHCREACEGEE
ncbi:putative outer membrane efflux protein [Candidatus Protochlamydia naegleriophila]|uniref:Putative outer membrane efflux protein n=1 Tax=Candidatus Protochlamydia naegleriophila TaxID=389348 RepID=A0A0U5JFU7_9BACT|nr:TolC family protein [Candidatus Protochlamydia naegleriophila]CUI16614.1 putative outer membrane efflux protein [Candidatus Protochlamydia naegleriophila]